MKPHPIFRSTIRDRTKVLLSEYLRLKVNTFSSISNATGLSDTWIAMFHRGELKHTDIGRVEKLHDHISAVKIKDLLSFKNNCDISN